MLTKKQLAIELSKFKPIKEPNEQLEQYSLDIETAAELLWHAFMHKDIEGKVIADFGCGNGILGGSALLLDAKHVHFVDTDQKMIELSRENVKSSNTTFHCTDITKFKTKVDTVIQNPPFGVKHEHADKVFLEQAFKVADTVYSIHKIESKEFIEQFVKEHDYTVETIIPFDFVLSKTLRHHRKSKYVVKCGCWVLRGKKI